MPKMYAFQLNISCTYDMGTSSDRVNDKPVINSARLMNRLAALAEVSPIEGGGNHPPLERSLADKGNYILDTTKENGDWKVLNFDSKAK